MARKKLPEAGVPEWMVSYGDMMGLLLCFFIMLYAMSTLDIPKFESAAESISNALGSPSKAKTKGSPGKPRMSVMGRKTPDGGGAKSKSSSGQEENVQSIRLDEQPVRGGLVSFDVNSADLNDRAKSDLDIIFEEINASPFVVMIKGHSSNGEMGGSTRDRDLSYNRAWAVYEYFVAEKNMNPEVFQIHAVGPHQPLGRRGLAITADPRAANAVVEVFLISNMRLEFKGSKADQQNKFISDTPM